jgi:hypothetical protein
MPKGINIVNYATHDSCITKNQEVHKMFKKKVDLILFFLENNHNYMRVLHLEGEIPWPITRCPLLLYLLPKFCIFKYQIEI